MKQLFIVLFVFSASVLYGQNHHFRFENFDVKHYSFEIHLNDTTNEIRGKTLISVNLLKPNKEITFDITGREDTTKTGMNVSDVKLEGKKVPFKHTNNKLVIDFESEISKNQRINMEIDYSGVPADGLIISENTFGDRTFFGDNWPDRAKHWLPTIDHPSDKATVEFLVYAPAHYEVISNGYLAEKKQLEDKTEFTHWKENVPIPTKLMVIGVANFEIEYFEDKNRLQISNWVFPQNSEKAFENYRFHSKAIEYFSDLIGPYSYEKLAHVQSKTRYGGMENASCIFYHEKTGTSNHSQEYLFAHETAHQWFGNSVTEQNWHHVWLSEGFATYLTHVYIQHFFGKMIFREGLLEDREKIIKYANRNFAPVIDTTVTEYIRLLNTNSYQKGSWFLHMLRENLGNEIFFKGLRKYYTDFRDSTALTKDFQTVMESVSGNDLDLFFYQWLYQPGFPIIKVQWKQKSNKKLNLKISQIQKEYLFDFPLDIEIRYKNGESIIETIEINKSKIKASFHLKDKVESIITDPETKLLFEEIP